MRTPRPLLIRESSRLLELSHARLRGVHYHFFPPVHGKQYEGGHDGVDELLAAVELDLHDQAVVLITWAMDRDLQGLSVSHGEHYSGTAVERLDASDRPAWRTHLGSSIRSVAASWHVSGDDCPESLWSLRLDFMTGAVVIALGTINHMIEYSPNELVVIADPKLAQSYRPRHVIDSAWGASPW